jgi:hypothetical protein
MLIGTALEELIVDFVFVFMIGFIIAKYLYDKFVTEE